MEKFNMFENCGIELVVETPEHKILRAKVTIDEEIYRKSFKPLPSNRELPWEIQQKAAAYEQERLRCFLANCIAARLTRTIIELFETQDTINGYKKEDVT